MAVTAAAAVPTARSSPFISAPPAIGCTTIRTVMRIQWPSFVTRPGRWPIQIAAAVAMARRSA
jgi:hypothetical protein